MASKVSKIERISHDNKANPYTREYAIESQIPGLGEFYCLISPTEWGFIYDGIINPPLRNILDKKGIYLEYFHDAEEYLTMSETDRASDLAKLTFETKEEFEEYCLKNRIEIIDTFVVNFD